MAELYGSISYSRSTGMSGMSWNYANADDAANEAFYNCGYNDCETLMVFTECGAIAVGDGYGFGYAYKRSLDNAINTALQQCGKYSNNCQITASFCNDGY